MAKKKSEKDIFVIYVTEVKGWKFMISNILRTETFPNKIRFTKIFVTYTLSSHDS